MNKTIYFTKVVCTIAAVIVVASATSPAYTTDLLLVDEFPSPVGHPPFALDFDKGTNTL